MNPVASERVQKQVHPLINSPLEIVIQGIFTASLGCQHRGLGTARLVGVGEVSLWK